MKSQPGKTNREWHESHRMPRNPTLQQRIDWHIEHAKHCSCRPMPAGIVAAMKEMGLEP